MAVNGDKRAFAEIQLQGRLLVGLLDTGASVSLLGAGGPELIEQLGLKMTPSTTTVQAAGGTQHRIIGKINATIKFANKERFSRFTIVGVEALDQVESEFLTKSEPVEPHILDAARQEKLEEVKKAGSDTQPAERTHKTPQSELRVSPSLQAPQVPQAQAQLQARGQCSIFPPPSCTSQQCRIISSL
ncbi:hypothetical protein ACLKA6_001938 [Drosophila palustris]